MEERVEETMKMQGMATEQAEEVKEETETEESTAMEQEENEAPGFWQDDRGVGVIEIVLILVILIGLVLVFKDQITAIVNNAFTAISGNAGKIIN